MVKELHKVLCAEATGSFSSFGKCSSSYEPLPTLEILGFELPAEDYTGLPKPTDACLLNEPDTDLPEAPDIELEPDLDRYRSYIGFIESSSKGLPCIDTMREDDLFKKIKDSIGEFSVVNAFHEEVEDTLVLICEIETYRQEGISLEFSAKTGMPLHQNDAKYTVVTIYNDRDFMVTAKEITKNQANNIAAIIVGEAPSACSFGRLVDPPEPAL